MTNGRVKGDLFVGNNVYANGEELATNTALTDGLASKLDLAGGKILQVVRATDDTQRSTTSTSFVDGSISVTITPQKSTSAVVLIWSVRIAQLSASESTYLQITDNSNNAISGAEETELYSSAGVIAAHQTIFAYATPATTSATTYKGRFRVSGGTGRLNNGGVNTGQLFAIEVSA